MVEGGTSKCVPRGQMNVPFLNCEKIGILYHVPLFFTELRYEKIDIPYSLSYTTRSFLLVLAIEVVK